MQEHGRLPDLLIDAVRDGPTTILTGAGLSTESGIPDYRGPKGTLKTRPPIKYQDFVRNPATRRRYWARSAVGYPRLASRRPNRGHQAVAQLEDLIDVELVVTQNVDGLHQASGSSRVVELHGSLREVVCLACGAREARSDFQDRIRDANRDWPGWDEGTWEQLPDGDARLPDSAVAGFDAPLCLVCGGELKPDVVFFGETVPRARVDAAFAAVSRSRNLLVLGSSLMVFSGYRFADAMAKSGGRILIVTDGETRADGLAEVKIAARLGVFLPWMVDMLTGRRD